MDNQADHPVFVVTGGGSVATTASSTSSGAVLVFDFNVNAPRGPDSGYHTETRITPPLHSTSTWGPAAEPLGLPIYWAVFAAASLSAIAAFHVKQSRRQTGRCRRG